MPTRTVEPFPLRTHSCLSVYFRSSGNTGELLGLGRTGTDATAPCSNTTQVEWPQADSHSGRLGELVHRGSDHGGDGDLVIGGHGHRSGDPRRLHLTDQPTGKPGGLGEGVRIADHV